MTDSMTITLEYERREVLHLLLNQSDGKYVLQLLLTGSDGLVSQLLLTWSDG